MRPALFACLFVVAGCSQTKPEPTPKAELPKSVQTIEPVAKASPPEAPKGPQVDISKLANHFPAEIAAEHEFVSAAVKVCDQYEQWDKEVTPGE